MRENWIPVVGKNMSTVSLLTTYVPFEHKYRAVDIYQRLTNRTTLP